MDYEQMLDQAYETVDVTEVKERFEIIKVEGHHEGNKTVLTNFGPIAAHLRRDPQHIAKFLSKELASQTDMSKERLIMNRKLSSKDINAKIIKYVSQFVTCSNCKKPDTELTEEGNAATVRCLACGTKKQVHNN